MDYLKSIPAALREWLLRSSGTFISATVSLGCDVPRDEVEKCLLEAARRADLADPFVFVYQRQLPENRLFIPEVQRAQREDLGGGVSTRRAHVRQGRACRKRGQAGAAARERRRRDRSKQS